MGSEQPARLPPGRQPYDPANGLRVGTFAGGLAAAAVSALVGLPAIWLVPAGAATGGLIGFLTERRNLRDS